MKINLKEILIIFFVLLSVLGYSQQDFTVYFSIEEQYHQEYNAEGMTYNRTIEMENPSDPMGLITYSPSSKMFRVIGPGPTAEYSNINIIKKDSFEKKVLLGNEKLNNPGGVYILIDYATRLIHVNDCRQDKIYISIFDIAKIYSDCF